MDKKEASTDVTYCNGKNCTNKCWRHTDNWKFDINNNYWLMDSCNDVIGGKENDKTVGK